MRLSQLLVHRHSGTDSDLLVRAGYTHRLGNGLYSLLPLGNRVLQRVTNIVRRELECAGAQEVTMPLLQPQSLWQQRIGRGGTRAEAFGPQLFRIHGGTGDWVLAPTHEEIATLLGAACIRRPRDLPRTIFQIQPRFRDELFEAKEGLLRTREFVMADAYSFHADEASLDETYAAMTQAVNKALAGCGVVTEVVKASSGAIGGNESEEVIAPLPETKAVKALKCGGCGYAAGVEIAEFHRSRPEQPELLPLEEVAVPEGMDTDAAIASFSLSDANRLCCAPFIADTRVVLAVLPANLSLNPAKLVSALSRANIQAEGIHRASAEELVRLSGSYDWISLVRTPPAVFVIADESVRTGCNFIFPSPRSGNFLVHVNSGRDFRVDLFADLALAVDGDVCVRCGGILRAIHGTEVAHLFKLGSGYAAAFGACIGSSPLQMGCYGLGITRLIAAIVQQNRDERGIVWPKSIAPYVAIIVPRESGIATTFAAQVYERLRNSKLEILFDDSDTSAEEKLKYADLLGIPFQIVTSGNLKCGDNVEIRERSSSELYGITIPELTNILQCTGRIENPFPSLREVFGSS